MTLYFEKRLKVSVSGIKLSDFCLSFAVNASVQNRIQDGICTKHCLCGHLLGQASLQERCSIQNVDIEDTGALLQEAHV